MSRFLFNSIIAATLFALVACSKPDEELSPTIESKVTIRDRQLGIIDVSDSTRIWVRDTDEHLIDSTELQMAHFDVLSGQEISFTDKISSISPSQDKAVFSVRVADGNEGIAMVRGDGYKMSMYITEDTIIDVGQVTFAHEYGLALVPIEFADGKRIVALNNYGRQVYFLPVTDIGGRIRYSTKELDYLVIDRSIVSEEIELVPYDRPGETTIIRRGEVSEDGEDIYSDALELISNWS